MIGATAAHADSVADFYRGKTMRVVIGYGPGGNYDLYGRLAAEFLGRHIPGNPTIVPVNMPGAGGFKAIDYLYKVAPQDGTYLGSVAQQLAMTLRRRRQDRHRPDAVPLCRPPHRDGRCCDGAAEDRHHLVRGHAQARSHGRRRPGVSTSALYARALNAYAGSRFKIVTGYSGTAEIQLAVERGEVDVNGGESLPIMLVAVSRLAAGQGRAPVSERAQAVTRCWRRCRP